MIIYDRPGPFGLGHLTRVHGSAVYKTFLPSVFSTLVLVAIHNYRQEDDKIIEHPYAVGAFVSFFAFLLTFRLNYGYQRYWEASSAVHQMMSKFLDCALALSAFHYQSESYNKIRPQPFGKEMKANATFGKKRHFKSASMEETIHFLEAIAAEQEEDMAAKQGGMKWWQRNRKRSRSTDSLASQFHQRELSRRTSIKNINQSKTSTVNRRGKIPIPLRFQAQFTGGIVQSGDDTSNSEDDRPSLKQNTSRVPAPSLFLQELAHLFSLLNAVALSTLRNDMEFAESPIVEYFPGQAWPPVDPDELSPDIQKQYHLESPWWRSLSFVLGLQDSPQFRTLYNAARPFGVLGGVSDQEIKLLQRARGPSAKVSLCTMWIQEFISREYLAGSTGQVAPPIISRLYQIISDGMVGYNQARKVGHIGFPFPHAQSTSFFVAAVTVVFPVLYGSYVASLGFACFLNFSTVLCFIGLHEVARELEDPFQNIPNDLPLTTFQAQINEALVTIYAGFHPDSWWDASMSQKISQTHIVTQPSVKMKREIAVIPELEELE